MEFGVKERLMLLSVMPGQGNLTALRLVRQAKEELGFDEEEHRALGLAIEGNSYRWDDEAEAKAGPKDVEMGEVVRGMVLRAFEDLDGADRLELVHLDLYERFMEDAKGENENKGGAKTKTRAGRRR